MKRALFVLILTFFSFCSQASMMPPRKTTFNGFNIRTGWNQSLGFTQYLGYSRGTDFDHATYYVSVNVGSNFSNGFAVNALTSFSITSTNKGSYESLESILYLSAGFGFEYQDLNFRNESNLDRQVHVFVPISLTKDFQWIKLMAIYEPRFQPKNGVEFSNSFVVQAIIEFGGYTSLNRHWK